MAQGHQSRVAPARGLPSKALAKGGGKAEQVGLHHSGPCSWLARLRFFRGCRPAGPFPIPIFLTTKATKNEDWVGPGRPQPDGRRHVSFKILRAEGATRRDNPSGTDYQSGSWILLNGLGSSQPGRYRTPNRRAPNLASRRFDWFNTLAIARLHVVGLRRCSLETKSSFAVRVSRLTRCGFCLRLFHFSPGHQLPVESKSGSTHLFGTMQAPHSFPTASPQFGA